jgi:hypothetical protein
MSAMNIIAGPKGLKPGDELTVCFFFSLSRTWIIHLPTTISRTFFFCSSSQI